MTKADVIRMENGKKDLPIGISRTKYNSYRLQRAVNGKKYRFGSFRNLELALSVNAGIAELVEDLRISQEKEGILSVNEIQSLIVENSVSDMEEITNLFNALDRSTSYQLDSIESQIAELHKASNEKKSFWQRIIGRSNKL